jgi:hypothetical protein
LQVQKNIKLSYVRIWHFFWPYENKINLHDAVTAIVTRTTMYRKLKDVEYVS